MRKDKRKKRLSRKQKRINKLRLFWANLIEANKGYLNAPMPKILVRDYIRDNEPNFI